MNKFKFDLIKNDIKVFTLGFDIQFKKKG